MGLSENMVPQIQWLVIFPSKLPSWGIPLVQTHPDIIDVGDVPLNPKFILKKKKLFKKKNDFLSNPLSTPMKSNENVTELGTSR